MARDSATVKARNKRVRQEALREQLQAQGHVQHVVDILDKLDDDAVDYSALDLQRKKIIIDTKLKLIGKYLPDVKQQEIELQAEHVFAQVSDEITVEAWEEENKPA